MAKCEVCEKSVLFGNQVSHSHRRSNKIWKPNVKRVNIQTEAGNRRVYVCTSCLRSGKVKRAEIKTAE
ncbi:MAG: 50S ribosomal protein L28 [Eubacteriales bacterium]|nr:50S ribosomal protein L28 [Eubacteriales bacterium]